MNKTISIWILLSLFISANAQKVWFSVAPTRTNFIQIPIPDGGPGHKYKFGISTSFEYIHSNLRKIDFGFGFSYQLGRVEYIPNMNTPSLIQHTEYANLFSINLILNNNLRNDFYIKFSPSIDFHIFEKSDQSIDNQSGIGISFSTGKHYKLNENILLNIEPRIWIHNIVPFIEERFPERLIILGINFGIAL